MSPSSVTRLLFSLCRTVLSRLEHISVLYNKCMYGVCVCVCSTCRVDHLFVVCVHLCLRRQSLITICIHLVSVSFMQHIPDRARAGKEMYLHVCTCMHVYTYRVVGPDTCATYTCTVMESSTVFCNIVQFQQ